MRISPSLLPSVPGRQLHFPFLLRLRAFVRSALPCSGGGGTHSLLRSLLRHGGGGGGGAPVANCTRRRKPARPGMKDHRVRPGARACASIWFECFFYHRRWHFRNVVGKACFKTQVGSLEPATLPPRFPCVLLEKFSTSDIKAGPDEDDLAAFNPISTKSARLHYGPDVNVMLLMHEIHIRLFTSLKDQFYGNYERKLFNTMCPSPR